VTRRAVLVSVMPWTTVMAGILLLTTSPLGAESPERRKAADSEGTTQPSRAGLRAFDSGLALYSSGQLGLSRDAAALFAGLCRQYVSGMRRGRAPVWTTCWRRRVRALTMPMPDRAPTKHRAFMKR